MPAPVTFNISLAPLTGTFTGTPQELADAIVARLSISPSVPWSSFLNGSSIPTSDNGPVLYQGNEWRVWSEGLGGYTYHRQNGAGLVDGTVTNAKLADGTAGSILIYDSGGRPVQLPSSGVTDGKVLTMVSGMPTYAETFVPSKEYFETTVSVDQPVNTNSSVQLVNFNTVRHSANITYNTGSKRAPVLANTVWFVYANLQVEDTGAASTNVQMQLDIRLNGASTGVSTLKNYATAQDRFGIGTCGIIVAGGSDGYIDVAVSADETTPAADGLTIAGNAVNTRFGGFRII